MRLRTTMFFFGWCFWLLLAAMSSPAQVSHPTEYQLKAAFLYNFAKFIDWPAEALPDDQSPFVIGILGDNPFGNELEQTVAGKKINEHPISVRQFTSVAATTNCHILFISGSEPKHLAEIIQSLNSAAVLTVVETGQFKESNGMVNFVKESSKIHFEINNEKAKAAHLTISSKLLNLALRAPH